jgi:hypothetical protein
MAKPFTVAQGWKLFRRNGTSISMWQHEVYKVEGGSWDGTLGSLMYIIEDEQTVAARLSIPGGYIVVDPESLSQDY